MRHSKKLLVLSSLMLSACEPKDDPGTLKKLEEKKAEVAALETELESVEAQIKEIRTTDMSEDLAKLQTQVAEEKAKQSSLEEEIAELTQNKEAAEKYLADFQKKYPLRP